jgi:hypothetical protein
MLVYGKGGIVCASGLSDDLNGLKHQKLSTEKMSVSPYHTSGLKIDKGEPLKVK